VGRRLRSQQVLQVTLNRCMQRDKNAEIWFVEHRLKHDDHESLDRALSLFFNHLAEKTEEPTGGAYKFQLLKCNLPTALEKGAVEFATAMAAQFELDTYFRPSEAITLKDRQITPPALDAGAPYQKWVAILAPSEERRRTKTGPIDACVVIGDVTRPGLKDALAHWMREVGQDEAVFPELTLKKYEDLWQRLMISKKYPVTLITPHVLRPTDASNDIYHGRRDLALRNADVPTRALVKTCIPRLRACGMCGLPTNSVCGLPLPDGGGFCQIPNCKRWNCTGHCPWCGIYVRSA
jgi:hypothetical protein